MGCNTLLGSVDVLLSEQITDWSVIDGGGAIGLFLGTLPSSSYIIPTLSAKKCDMGGGTLSYCRDKGCGFFFTTAQMGFENIYNGINKDQM